MVICCAIIIYLFQLEHLLEFNPRIVSGTCHLVCEGRIRLINTQDIHDIKKKFNLNYETYQDGNYAMNVDKRAHGQMADRKHK